MDTQILNEKLELIQWLSALEDPEIIHQLIELKKKTTEEWWNRLSDEEKRSIERGLEQAKKENLVPHSKAKMLYEKWI